MRDKENVKFLWFEDMKKDQRKILEDLSNTLDHPLTPSQMDSLVDHVKFESMKANPNANPMVGMEIESAGNFFRKGEVRTFCLSSYRHKYEMKRKYKQG